jgi:hypothetical protein
MKLSEQIVAITRAGRSQGKSDEFIALAVIFWLEWNLSLSLGGNGFLDDDEATRDALGDKVQLEELKKFMTAAGIVSWYNRAPG